MLRHRGFTLLEVLVAIAITVIVATMAYSALESSMRTLKVAEVKVQELANISTCFTLIERDMNHIVADVVVNQENPERSPNNGTYIIRFIKSGWLNFMPDKVKRSHLQQVAYALEDNKLVRYNWVFVGMTEVKPTRVVMLNDVMSTTVRLLDPTPSVKNDLGGQWVDKWSGASFVLLEITEKAKVQVPLAIELMIEHKSFGKITRIYDLATE